MYKAELIVKNKYTILGDYDYDVNQCVDLLCDLISVLIRCVIRRCTLYRISVSDVNNVSYFRWNLLSHISSN